MVISKEDECKSVPYVAIDCGTKRVLSVYKFTAIVSAYPDCNISGSLEDHFRRDHGDSYREFNSDFKREMDDDLIKSRGLNPKEYSIIRGTVILEE